MRSVQPVRARESARMDESCGIAFAARRCWIRAIWVAGGSVGVVAVSDMGTGIIGKSESAMVGVVEDILRYS